jgi:hypothetical protein
MGYNLRIGVQREVLEECAAIHNCHLISIVRESVIKICNLDIRHDKLNTRSVSMDSLVGNGQQLACNKKSAGVHSGMDYHGKWFAIGSHANLKRMNIVHVLQRQ